jgi:hypothetical protein
MINDIITLDTIIRRNDAKFIANKIGEEMVMMNMENGDFISMNKVGTDIWALCEQPMLLKEMVQRLLSSYDISFDQCVSETSDFLRSAVEQKIFIVQNAHSA